MKPKHNWQLVVDGISVSLESLPFRPRFCIEEKEISPGVFAPTGSNSWVPIPLNMVSWEGEKEVELKLYAESNLLETWKLKNASIKNGMLCQDEVYFNSAAISA